MSHRAGFVNIIGMPNSGKSTLMNALVGEKLAITNSKVQTTRHRIMGIINGEDFQMVFSDTPGIIEPHYRMQEGMMQFVKSALSDADVLLLVDDLSKSGKGENEQYQKVLKQIGQMKVPIIIAMNKVDLITQEEVETIGDKWKELFPEAHVIAISALHKFNTEELRQNISKLLPESEPFFPKDQLTDKTERFFVSEIIREKILTHYKQEIPYSVEIEVEEFKEEEKIIRIRAMIFVLRESQKGIIIGKAGRGIKRIGTEARKDMEEFLQKKVFLDLQVKVNKDWRESERQLKRFGYLN